MRHLVYIKPQGEVLRYLETLDVTPPSSGFHCTLWGFNVSGERADEVYPSIANDLLDLSIEPTPIEPFHLSTRGIEQFDNSSLALLLQGEGIRELHKRVVRETRKYDKRPELHKRMAEMYGLEKYSPHITITKQQVTKPIKQPQTPLEMEITHFYLARRNRMERIIQRTIIRYNNFLTAKLM